MAGVKKEKGLKGLNEVLRNLNNEIKQMKQNTMAGIWEASFEIERKSKELTPVDTGNLKASAYTRKVGTRGVEVGYAAEYALWVHEMVGEKLRGQPREDFGVTADGLSFGGGTGKGTYWESGESKFLEKAVFDTDIIGIVRRRAKVS